MKLEEQVVSLELAKKLKELGIEQESLFYWDEGRERILYQKPRQDMELANIYSAFTVAELGEMLPYDIAVLPDKYRDGWGIVMNNFEIVKDKLEADARAKMLVYLLENKLIEPNR